MNLHHVIEVSRHYGPGAGAHDLAKRVGSKLANLRVLKLVVLTPDDLAPGSLEAGGEARGDFLDEAEFARWAANPELGLDEGFVREARAAGDRCFGIWWAGEPVSYGWYSRQPTKVEPGLMLHFAPEYVYMYKGYTLPAHRGKRLHALGMASALVAYVRDGSTKGIVSYVESNNFASLRSCHRMGYRDVGAAVTWTVGGRRFVRQFGDGAEYGLRLEVVA